MSVTTVSPDAAELRLYSIRELADLGYGSKPKIRERILAGVVPAVMVGNTYKIRATDLHLLAVPVVPSERAADVPS